MNRRQFLQSSLQQGGALFLLANFASLAHAIPCANYLVSCHGAELDLDHNIKKTRDMPSLLMTMNLETGSIVYSPLPILAHSFSQDPQIPSRALGVVKWTKSAILVDLSSGKQLHHLEAPKNYLFFGHSTFDKTGRKAFVTADSDEEGRGILCVYDTNTWKLEHKIDLGCRHPHECLLTLDHQIAVVGHQHGFKGVLKIVDSENYNTIKTIKTPIAGHLLQLDQDRFLVAGGTAVRKPELAVIDIKANTEKNIYESTDFNRNRLPAQALSLAKISDDEVVATLSHSYELLVWNIKSNRAQTYKLDGFTKGLVIYDDKLYVTFAKKMKIYDLKAKSALNLAVPNELARLASGPHLKLFKI